MGKRGSFNAAAEQAKVKEPELYELHDRVRQIRQEMNTLDGAQQDVAQHGVATQ